MTPVSRQEFFSPPSFLVFLGHMGQGGCQIFLCQPCPPAQPRSQYPHASIDRTLFPLPPACLPSGEGQIAGRDESRGPFIHREIQDTSHLANPSTDLLSQKNKRKSHLFGPLRAVSIGGKGPAKPLAGLEGKCTVFHSTREVPIMQLERALLGIPALGCAVCSNHRAVPSQFLIKR
jgi:hypothetical protein